MKKPVSLILAVMLVMSIVVPVSACSANYTRFGGWGNLWSWWSSWWDAPSIPDTPTITEARYYHGNYERLQIQWTEVEGADRYIVEITKADGTVIKYYLNQTSMYLSDVECPKMYVEETSTWTAATVRVKAENENRKGSWSDPVKIGCDMLHSV